MVPPRRSGYARGTWRLPVRHPADAKCGLPPCRRAAHRPLMGGWFPARMRKSAITTVTVLAVVLGGVGVANALGGDDEREGRATGPGAEQAKAAALELVPGGTANAVERDSEKGATWEVEVARPDGSTVDVRLDADLHKVAIDQDSEAEDR